MSLFNRIFKKEEKKKGCCSFNLDAEIAKAEEKKKSSCCDFNLDNEIAKVREEEEKKSCCK